MNNIPEQSSDDNRYSILLPCAPSQFSDFIGGLLGRPQTISWKLRGSFEIDKNEIRNIHELVCQRVSQQNHGNLLQFTVQLACDDNSSVLLNSFDDFLAYNEIRPVSIFAANLSWTFLIQFQDRNVPEKQVIDLSFFTQGGLSLDDSDHLEVPAFLRTQSGSVEFRIKHTARTWGVDIQGLLENHLKVLVERESTIRSFITKNTGKISLLLATIIIGSTFLGIFKASNQINEKRHMIISALTGSKIGLSEKLDALLSLDYAGSNLNFGISAIAYIMAALILSIVMAAWIETTTGAAKPSFLLLSPVSIKNRTKRLNSYRNRWLSFGISVVFSVVTGVISSIIYGNYWS